MHTEGSTRDFLSQVLKVKIFSPSRGRLWKGPKMTIFKPNCTFGHFDRPKWHFYANFPHCHQEGSTRDFLSKVWNVKRFSSPRGRLWMWPKMTIFKPKLDMWSYWPPKWHFYANFVSCPQQGKTRDFKALSNSWCNTF